MARSRRRASVDWFSHVLGLQHVDRAEAGSRQVGRGQVHGPCVCVRHLGFFFRMSETQRNAERLFLYEHRLAACSRGFSFVREMVEKEGRLVPISVDNEQFREGILVHVELSVHRRRVGSTVLQLRWTSREQHEEVRVGCVGEPEEGDRLCEGDWLDGSWRHL